MPESERIPLRASHRRKHNDDYEGSEPHYYDKHEAVLGLIHQRCTRDASSSGDDDQYAADAFDDST